MPNTDSVPVVAHTDIASSGAGVALVLFCLQVMYGGWELRYITGLLKLSLVSHEA